MNSANCEEIKDMFDSSGSYLKTVCLVDTAGTYDDAEAICQSYGMSLYDSNSLGARIALLSYVTTRFSTVFPINLRINGKAKESCAVVQNRIGVVNVYSSNCNSSYFSYCQFSKAGKHD